MGPAQVPLERRQRQADGRQPQPAAAPGPTQLLPIKTYREPVPPKRKTVTASSRVSDLVEVVGVGQFRIRVPRGFDFRVKGDPFALAEQMTLDRLMAEALDGSLSWPDGITGPAKRMTPAERKAERIATIRRIAEGPKDYAAMRALARKAERTPDEGPSLGGAP